MKTPELVVRDSCSVSGLAELENDAARDAFDAYTAPLEAQALRDAFKLEDAGLAGRIERARA